MSRDKILLLIINGGLFLVIGSLIGRLHVLQAWMDVSYEYFSWVLFSFSLGSVISNLVSGRLVRWQGPKLFLTATMGCIALALLGFILKPSYTTLIGLWALLSFGFTGSMVVVMSQAGIVQQHQGKSWMSFFQGISGIGVISGMGIGLLANTLEIPINAHFPLVGLVILVVMLPVNLSLNHFKQEKNEERQPFKISFSLLFLGGINFSLILSVSQIISWSGILLRDHFQFEDDTATLGSLGFIIAETVVRFSGDFLSRKLGNIRLLLGAGTLTFLSILSVYLFQSAAMALAGLIVAGLFSGTVQPIVFSLCSDERGNMTNNLSFVLLFQSIAFLVGPIVSGSIAENVGLFEIYLFSSLMAFLIVFFSFAYGRIKPP